MSHRRLTRPACTAALSCLGLAAKARNEAIGSAADAALKVEAKPIPEIPKDWAKHEAEVKKTSDKATGSAAGRLGKHSRQHVAAVERKFLTADHNG